MTLTTGSSGGLGGGAPNFAISGGFDAAGLSAAANMQILLQTNNDLMMAIHKAIVENAQETNRKIESLRDDVRDIKLNLQKNDNTLKEEATNWRSHTELLLKEQGERHNQDNTRLMDMLMKLVISDAKSPAPFMTLPAPAAAVTLPAPSVSVTTSPPDVKTPIVATQAPVVTVPAPAVSVPAPAMSVPAPSVTVPAPDVTVPAPAVTVPAPVMTTQAPVVTVPAPAVSVPAPSVTVPAPVVTVPAPAVSVPAPSVTVSAPSVTLPAPAVTVPAPVVTASAPIVAAPAPVVATPSPFASAGGSLFGGAGPKGISFADLAKNGGGGGLFGGGFNKPAFGASPFKSAEPKNFSFFTPPKGSLNGSVRSDDRGEDGSDKEEETPEDYTPDVHYDPVIDLPPEVEVVSGEENEEVFFISRCKLYRFDRDIKENKERGLGDIKILKNVNTQKFRCVMRREKVLKLCLNFPIVPELKLHKREQMPTVYTWACKDFSDDPVCGQDETFSVRFKDLNVANEFVEKMNEAIQQTKMQQEE